MSSTCTGSAFLTAQLGALGFSTVLLLSGCSSPAETPRADTAATASNGAQPHGGSDETFSPSITPEPPTSTYKPATAEGPAENVPMPVMPELSKEESKEGLEAFGDYWFSLINYGYETGDAAPVREISAPDCSICQSFYSDLEEGYVNDDWIQGGKLTVLSSGTEFAMTPDGRYQLLLSVIQEAGANRGPNGKVYGQGPADEASTAQIMEATYSSGRWVVNLVENM